ncbi:MAG TPA: DUF2721 domain-containing protein [Aliidongia sp.]|uniref:DUF2721 domain-containing protein n=1 Tax=Aliidongia sp. TaxID=1914230 RepID=UPI002DDCDB26|nr:DUF2721 domain-containing protein [Aliidongia sp.]HEV2673015.1 DUF2721 domain-containing protein [Aliidongia sp.]
MTTLPGLSMDDVTGGIAHVIQTALTPVFFLSGIGALLNLFNARLARVSDHLAHAADLLRNCPDGGDETRLHRQLRRLARRTWLLDAAIALGAVGGASTCGAALSLFLQSYGSSAVGGWTIALFASALGCTVSALVVFLGDSVLAWHGLRREGPLPRSLEASKTDPRH